MPATGPNLAPHPAAVDAIHICNHVAGKIVDVVVFGAIHVFLDAPTEHVIGVLDAPTIHRNQTALGIVGVGVGHGAVVPGADISGGIVGQAADLVGALQDGIVRSRVAAIHI